MPIGEAAALQSCVYQYGCEGPYRSWLGKWLDAIPGWVWILFLLLFLILLVVPCCMMAGLWLWNRRRRRPRRDRVHSAYAKDEGNIFYTPPISRPSPPVFDVADAQRPTTTSLGSGAQTAGDPKLWITVPPSSTQQRGDSRAAEQYGEFGNFASIPLAPKEGVFGPSRRLSDPYPLNSEWKYQHQPHAPPSPFYGGPESRWVECVEEEEYVSETVIEEPISRHYGEPSEPRHPIILYAMLTVGHSENYPRVGDELSHGPAHVANTRVTTSYSPAGIRTAEERSNFVKELEERSFRKLPRTPHRDIPISDV